MIWYKVRIIVGLSKSKIVYQGNRRHCKKGNPVRYVWSDILDRISYIVGRNSIHWIKQLPDLGPLSLFEVHGLARFYIECSIKFGHIFQRAKYTVFTQRVRIFFGPAKDLFVADVLRPNMCIS